MRAYQIYVQTCVMYEVDIDSRNCYNAITNVGVATGLHAC